MTKTNVKLNGFALQLDAYVWCIIVLIIACIGLIGITAATEMGNSATVRMEMGNIQTAIVSYQAYRIDGHAPSDLTVLFDDEAISANESKDGRSHGNFLEKTGHWSDGRLLDPWGEEYTLTLRDNDRHGTITSNGSGETITQDF